MTKLSKALILGPKPTVNEIVAAVIRFRSELTDEQAAIGAEREEKAIAPQLVFDAKRRRVVVDIRVPDEGDEGEPPDPESWSMRSVDVTDALRMTPAEIAFAGWNKPSRQAAGPQSQTEAARPAGASE